MTAPVGTKLALADARAPIPPGWLEGVFVPAVEAEGDWEMLDEAERRVNALVGYFDQNRADKATLEAALRAIEIRRVLLDDPSHACDASRQTRLRWRRLAEHRDVIWPEVLDAARKGRPDLTTQAHCLRLAERGPVVRDHEPEPVRVTVTRCKTCKTEWPCPAAESESR